MKLEFPQYNPIGSEEVKAASEVVKSGMLSDYIGRLGTKFEGGTKVREFEKKWADYHHVKHAITFNSATSALIAGIGSLGIQPGDEVLVIGYSMCISATAPLFYDAIPIFVDIEDNYFCMDPVDVEAKITSKTKAILPVDLFGQSTDMLALRKIAKKHNLLILSDSSHVPGARYLDGYAGTFGDIGVYSLNQHKIIHCGEGGVAVTNDDELAMKLKLIRNHAEAVVGDLGNFPLGNMLGGNYRLPEIESAIAIEQLKKLPSLIQKRIELANELTEQIGKIDFLQPPELRPTCEHVYYLYPILFDESKAGFSRETYLNKVRELGLDLYRFAGGYIKPLYQEPIFRKHENFKNGFPFNLNKSFIDYRSVTLPITESLYNERMIVTSYNYPPLTKKDMKKICDIFAAAGDQCAK